MEQQKQKPDRRHYRYRKFPLSITTSWDDGTAEDVVIQKMLDYYGLKGTFYLPSNCELTKDQIVSLANNHEIGGHTVSHPSDMKLLEYPKLVSEIRDNKEFLEDMIGKPITKFCYPRGRYNDQTIEVVKMVGYQQARTTVVLKTETEDPYRTPTTIHVYPRKEYNGKHWTEVARKMCDQASKNGQVFHLWGHSWEVISLNELDTLNKFFKYLSDTYELEPTL